MNPMHIYDAELQCSSVLDIQDELKNEYRSSIIAHIKKLYCDTCARSSCKECIVSDILSEIRRFNQ